MNICKFELKRQAKSLIVWTLALMSVSVILLEGFYPVMLEAKSDIEAIFSNFPPEVVATFGIDMEQMFSFMGFYEFVFLYISLMGAIMALNFSINIFSSEKQANCGEFLLAKPISRRRIFAQKLCACMLNIIFSNAIYGGVIIYIFSRHDCGVLSCEVMSSTFALLFTQLLFMCFGILWGIIAKKIRGVTLLSVGVGVFALMLSYINELMDKELLKFLSPLTYFSPKYFTENGCFSANLTILSIVICAVSLIVAFKRFIKEDISY